MRPVKFNLILALVLICLSSIGTAQSLSSLNFEVSGGEGGQFPILTNESGNAVEYDLQNGLVAYRIDPGVSYDNPLFCFQYSEQSSAVALLAEDASGHVVLESIGLDSVLTYELSTGSLALSPSPSVQCFFVGVDSQDPKFGLFGELADNQRSETVDEGSLFNDAFAAFPELDIQYKNLQINSGDSLSFGDVVVSPGDVIDYELVIENTGNAAADELAFQEVFPEYRMVNDLPESYFPAALSEGVWQCVPSGNAVCPGTAVQNPEIPGTTEGFGDLRFEPGSLQLPAGTSSLTFTITRQVMSGSEGSINLFAGAVNGPGDIAKNATAQATLDIVGEPVQLEFVQQPTDTTVGQFIDPPVVVEVVDSNGNRVTTDSSTPVALELHQSGGLEGLLDNGTNVTNGVVSFDSLDTSSFSAGTGYQIKAIHGVSTPTIGSRLSNQFDLISP